MSNKRLLLYQVRICVQMVVAQQNSVKPTFNFYVTQAKQYIVWARQQSQQNVLSNQQIQNNNVHPKVENFQSKGFIQFKVDCHTCHSTFQMNRKLSIQLIKLLQTNIIGSKCLDTQSLCIVTGKYVWKLMIQVTVVQDDGNVIDAVNNAVVIALLDMRKPMVLVDKTQIQIKPTKLQMLSIAHLPISMTFYFIQNNIFIDATHYQELASLTRLTITMNVYKQICSIHKPGGMGLDQQTISGAIKILEERIKEKSDQFREIVKRRSNQWA